jgi:hypothetical protein
MESVYISLIAVAGTLLGSAMTHVLQHRQFNRAASVATDERLRQERITVYSLFLEAMTAFGGQQILRWMARSDHGAESPQHIAARVTNHEARAVARAAHYRLMLIADESPVLASAQALMDATLAIMDAPDRESMHRSTDAARAASRAFVESARKQVSMLALSGSTA